MRRLMILPFVVASLAVSAEDGQSITVHGRGTVRVRPDKLILVFGASGKAEKAADAVAKLKTKTDEVKKAIEAILKNASLKDATMKDTGLSFGAPQDQMAMMMGGGNNEAAAEIAVSTELEVTIGGIDKMPDAEIAEVVSTLLDKAVEAGGEIKNPTNRYMPFMNQGGAAGVFFGFTDYGAQLDKAWDEAATKARERAEAIAKRLNVAVGEAIKIKDMSSTDGAGKQANPYAAMWGMMQDDEGPKIKSSGEVELSVEIEVEFRLKAK